MSAYEDDSAAGRDGPGTADSGTPTSGGMPTSGGGSASVGSPPAVQGLAALSLPYRVLGALALAVVALLALTHLGLVFLHVAPSNTVSKQHAKALSGWIYPEFEQNWKLFAPNPLQQDISVEARAEGRRPDGSRFTTGWYDLSAQDGRAIDGNPVPSHTQQNELRRAWDFYVASHDGKERPNGLRGQLSARYLQRIGVLRLDRVSAGGEGAVLERIRLRSRTTTVPPPSWSTEKVDRRPVYRQLPWWDVPQESGGVAAGARR